MSAQVASEENVCLEPLPPFSTDQQLQPGLIQVKANRTEIREDTIATFDGKVDILSDNARIKANNALINKNWNWLILQLFS